MNRILFVDDEIAVLHGLKRMLRTQCNEWDMTFVSSGAGALQCLSETEFDVLVTDIRMPGMSGIEVLEEVGQRYPRVMRVVLSGTADEALTVKSVSLAHQYLLKPCDPRSLRAALRRAFCLRLLLHSPRSASASGGECLPILPGIYSELVRMPAKGLAPQAIGKILERDSGMAKKVLELVNSAILKQRLEMADSADALLLLGTETGQALVLATAAFSEFNLQLPSCVSVDDTQRHGLAVGTLARQIARSMRLSPTAVHHAFIGGLFHDIGKLVLASHYGEQYQAALQLSRERQVSLAEIENGTWGTNHGEIGAYLLWLWGLPDPVTDILASHHRPSRDADVSPAVVAVHVANALVNGLSDQNMDLDCIRALNLEAGMGAWWDLHHGRPAGPIC
jgi:putative nucleotidyltransferase with HDIG domain